VPDTAPQEQFSRDLGFGGTLSERSRRGAVSRVDRPLCR